MRRVPPYVGSSANPDEGRRTMHNNTDRAKRMRLIQNLFLIVLPPMSFPYSYAWGSKITLKPVVTSLRDLPAVEERVKPYLLNEPLIWNGVTIWMAPFPFCGQSVTQQPQNQHSSGNATIGGFPFSGLGDNVSHMQTSTHVLHPMQASSLK
jgi:hypothetical protein